MLAGDAEYSYGGMVVYVEAAVHGIGGSCGANGETAVFGLTSGFST